VLLVLSDAIDWGREPGKGKYARPERERRFLVQDAVPAGEATRLIEDRYLDGLRLRLRRVTRDGLSVYKLTQKVRPAESDPSEVLITNMYLSEREYARLSTLPGSLVVKTRAVVATSTHNIVVDEFQGSLHGLRLAEVEVGDVDQRLDLPRWLRHEVTYDDRFSGGHLALLDEKQLRELLNRA
jgi:CYTH domain-containing protein